MKLTASVEVDASAPAIMSVVIDLATYPQWLDIVGNVRPDDQTAADPGPAWFVDLRAQLGPLRRSKRLRMVRSVANDRSVRFERQARWSKSFPVDALRRPGVAPRGPD